MASNAFLLDATSRHMLHLQRLAGGNVKEILPLLNGMRDRVVSRINRDELTLADAGRMRILLGDLSEMIEGMESQLGSTVNDQVRSLAEYEVGFTERMLSQASSVSIQGVSAEAVAAAVTDRPMTLLRGKAQQQLTIDQAVTRFARGVRRDVTTAIQAGIVAGEPTDRIARNIQGMVNNRSRAQAEAVVRTSTNHAANVAREELYRQNADVVAGERFVAVFDSRTTDTCAGYDGEVFPLGEGPIPALHYGCRSTRIVELRDEFQTDIDGQGRRTVAGPVGAQKTFGGWLHDQPAEFQRDYFEKFPDGDERYQLFSQGGLQIDQFTDAQGATLTLAEIRAREPMAFERAGLDGEL